MPKIILSGCTPKPLSNYLKALGVLRLVVEQNFDTKAKGYWLDDNFVLHTQREQDDLVQFFLKDYQPTPLVSPWNGRTGFYPQDNPKTLLAIQNSQTARLLHYRETIGIAQQQILNLKLTAKSTNKQSKKQLLTRLRNHLPDIAVRWLDTCALIAPDDNLKFPPLLGTGGNDNNFEFSRTFMQQLALLIDYQTGVPTENSLLLLQAALFGLTIPGLRFAGRIGQFNPIATGGVNAAPGYDADPRVNPWDYILMLEGTILFSSSATRRYAHSASADFAYPFTVRPSGVGYGSTSDADITRAELWVPLWSRPTGLEELQLFFHEGRATVAGRTARSGIDFALAIASRGIHRSIDAFIRYSFQARYGEYYFALPLGRIVPKFNPQVDTLVELDKWLLEFRRTINNAKAPASLMQAYRLLETTLFEFSQKKKQLFDVLISLGQIEAACDRSLQFTLNRFLQPIPLLSSKWAKGSNDSTAEFRLALALAGRGLRQRLVRVRRQSRYLVWAKDDDAITTWQQKPLVNNLIGLLQREMIEAQQSNLQELVNYDLTRPSENDLVFPTAQLDDIVRFIDGELNDARIEVLARGLSLVKLPKSRSKSSKSTLPIPAAYSLVAIAHYRTLKTNVLQKIFGQSLEIVDLTLPRVPALLTKLDSGDCFAATELAAWRLQASGLNPAIRNGIYEPPERSRRIAAALAFPIADIDLARLLRLICKTNSTKD